MKKILCGTLLAILVVGLAVLGGLWYFSPLERLQRLGYSAEEAQAFVATLTAEEVEAVLTCEYSADLAELLAAPGFNATQFGDYWQALEANGLSAAETVQLVNHPDYNPARRYTGAMLEIMRSPYYITANAERYFALLDTLAQDGVELADDVANSSAEDVAMEVPTTEQSAPELSVAEIVALVNANRDRDFYTDPEPADLTAGELLLVNKYYYLPADYAPDLATLGAAYGSVGVQLERTTREAFLTLYEAAKAAGFSLYVTSGYRGYGEQAAVFDEWVVKVGAEAAPSYAARPGYSDHQTGLALDVFVIGQTTATFHMHPAAAWLATHAWEYGFILRFAEGQEDLTGYAAEAWHFRYVGLTAAAEIHASGLTLEEYVAAKRAGLEIKNYLDSD